MGRNLRFMPRPWRTHAVRCIWLLSSLVPALATVNAFMSRQSSSKSFPDSEVPSRSTSFRMRSSARDACSRNSICALLLAVMNQPGSLEYQVVISNRWRKVASSQRERIPSTSTRTRAAIRWDSWIVVNRSPNRHWLAIRNPPASVPSFIASWSAVSLSKLQSEFNSLTPSLAHTVRRYVFCSGIVSQK